MLFVVAVVLLAMPLGSRRATRLVKLIAGAVPSAVWTG
jgi:hypothetical protein